MKEYEVYVPLRYNDGSAVEAHKITRIGELLLEHFEGMTFFPQATRAFGKWAA